MVARSYGWGWSKVSRFSGTRCGQKIGGATLTPPRDLARRSSYTFRVIKRILMVDDEPAVIELLKEFFKQFQHGHAYEVAAAHDGADAAIALLRGQYDLILLDMNMPRMGGLEFLKQIRGLGVRVPVIMVTGNQDVEAAAQALSGGVFAYVPKPFDFKQLDHLVALAVATRRPAAGDQPTS